MLKLRKLSAVGFYKPGTGEHGINDVQWRIKVGKQAYDPIYGYKLESIVGAMPSQSEFVRTVMGYIGYSKPVPGVYCVNTIPNGKYYGRAFYNTNQVILYRHTLGVLVHELAHFAAAYMLGDFGHRDGFKSAYKLMHAATYKVLALDGQAMYNDMIIALNERNQLRI